jgi:hypothetical protein
MPAAELAAPTGVANCQVTTRTGGDGFGRQVGAVLGFSFERQVSVNYVRRRTDRRVELTGLRAQLEP